MYVYLGRISDHQSVLKNLCSTILIHVIITTVFLAKSISELLLVSEW